MTCIAASDLARDGFVCACRLQGIAAEINAALPQDWAILAIAVLSGVPGLRLRSQFANRLNCMVKKWSACALR